MSDKTPDETGMLIASAFAAASFIIPFASWATALTFGPSFHFLLLGLGWGANLAGWNALRGRRSQGERIALLGLLVLGLLNLAGRSSVVWMMRDRF